MLKQPDLEDKPSTFKKLQTMQFPGKTLKKTLKEQELDSRKKLLQRFLSVLARDPHTGQHPRFLDFLDALSLRGR